MALRDWLNSGLAGLAKSHANENHIDCLKNNPKLAGLAGLAEQKQGGANYDVMQPIDFYVVSPKNSRNSENSSSNASELKNQGVKRLEAAAKGLPVTIAELVDFFANDLVSFGQGEVKQVGIEQAVKWFVYQHLGRYDPVPDNDTAKIHRMSAYRKR